MRRLWRVVVSLGVLAAACGGGVDGRSTASTGDQTVFSDHELTVWIAEQEHIDFDTRRTTPIPPIYLSTSIHVRVNDGKEEDRVDGLEVWIDGERLEETGSAAFPVSYSFQHHRKSAEPGHAYALELRYRGSTFATTVRAPALTIDAPPPEMAISLNDTFALRWSADGRGVVETSADASVYTANSTTPCATELALLRLGDGEAVYQVKESERGQRPPCTVEGVVRWQGSETVEGPFRKLVHQHTTVRRRRFAIR